MQFDYLNVLVFAGVGLAFVFVNLLIFRLVRPRRTVETGLETYECGEETIGDAWVQFDIRYYTVALVYVVFAVEIAFLFPWAIVLRDAMEGSPDTFAGAQGIGAFALIEGVIFIAILFLGLLYVWAKGDLNWILSFSAPEYRPPLRSESRYAKPSVQDPDVMVAKEATEEETESQTDEEAA
jgi:NADH-quinone oxidoreductase subunit A